MSAASPASTVRRLVYAAALGLVLIAGLPLRLTPEIMPPFMVNYGGDALWALAIFLGCSVLFPRRKVRTRALWALAVAYGIEFSELYQADWINAIRATRLGGLILGYTFLWSDLVCYAVGIGVGLLIETIWGFKRRIHDESQNDFARADRSQKSVLPPH